MQCQHFSTTHTFSIEDLDDEEVLSDNVHLKWDDIPQYCKTGMLIGKHLGKGTFSDVFELRVMEPTTKRAPGVHNNKSPINTKFATSSLIEAKFASSAHNDTTGCVLSNDEDDLDVEIDAMFTLTDDIKRAGRTANGLGVLASSICSGALSASSRQVTTYAMKCLRPSVRHKKEQFFIGITDLIHETKMLASLDHPNIVKLHGRAISGRVASSSFSVCDGYFILLLDRLTDTLDDRIGHWKKNRASLGRRSSKDMPTVIQIKTACSIADALSYLHSKNIVFCDLKPANVGFDSMGVLKLFDFGFATCVNQNLQSSKCKSSGQNHLLYEKCGTLRYMAPEVGLGLGYSLHADVYSFGVLLWQIFRLKKPFDHVKSAKQFHKEVFKRGARPKLSKHWPQILKDIISNCWSSNLHERPTMECVEFILHSYVDDLSFSQQDSGNDGRSCCRKSSVLQMFWR